MQLFNFCFVFELSSQFNNTLKDKKMKKIIYLFVAFVMSIPLFSCLDRIEGEGPIVTKELDLDEFESFALEGSFDIEVNYGEEQKVEAIGNLNIIERLNTWVEDGHWKAKLAKGSYANFSLKIKITLPEISRVILEGSGDIRVYSANSNNIVFILNGSGNILVPASLNNISKAKIVIEGSGNIKLDDISADEIESKIEGSGNIQVSGTTTEQTIKIEGSGTFKGYDMESDQTSVYIYGSGDVNINTSETLYVKIEGSGDVKYKGSPSVTSDIDGSGRIVRV